MHSNIRSYRKSPFVTPDISEVEKQRVHISALLADGYSITAIIRKLQWGNDLTLRKWLKDNPELDQLRQHNGLMAQRHSMKIAGLMR